MTSAYDDWNKRGLDMNKGIFRVLVGLIIISTYGCATMQDKWEKAAKEDTIQAYTLFLKNEKPDAEYKNKAETRIRELREAQRAKDEAAAFERARNSKRPEYDLQKFLSAYPSGKHAPEARKLLEQSAYNRAMKDNTAYAYSTFLSRYPNSEQAPDATARLRKIRFNNARKSESLSEYENFIKQYPEGEDTRELKNDLPRIQKLEQDRELEQRKFEQAKKLGEIALRMAPVIVSPTKRMPDGTTVQTLGGSKLSPPLDQKLRMAEFRKLLESGIDPNLVRISGFRPHYVYKGGAMSFGYPGKVVPAKQDGITLLEYFKTIGLKEGADLVKKYGGK